MSSKSGVRRRHAVGEGSVLRGRIVALCERASSHERPATQRYQGKRQVNGESSTYTIGAIGFERAESRMLQRVVGLSEHRQPTFGPFNKVSGGCPHVVVVNAD